MPLIKSGSKKAISTNIREMMHAGHPQDQAVAAALSTARKYRRKADGGSVEDDSWKDAEAKSNLEASGYSKPAAAPKQHDWSKGLRDWWYGGQPGGGADEFGGLPEVSMTEDPINKMLKAPFENAAVPGKAYREGLAPEEEQNFGNAVALGQIGRGLVAKPTGIGIGGGKGGYTKDITPEKIPDLHQTVMDASYLHASESPKPEKTAKDLKGIFPKDLATSAFYLGLDATDLNNVKSHLLPGAAESFDKHYAKLTKSPAKQVPIKEEQSEPPVWQDKDWEKKFKEQAMQKFLDEHKHLEPTPEADKLFEQEPWHPDEPPLGPEGFGAHEPVEEAHAVVKPRPTTSFAEAFKESLDEKYGGPWQKIKPIEGNHTDLLKALSSDTSHHMVSVLAHRHFDDAGLPPYGLEGQKLMAKMAKVDPWAMLTQIGNHHLSEQQIKNIFSYLPEEVQQQMKAKIAPEMEANGHPVWDQLGEFNPKKKDEVIKEAFKPIDWTQYKPPRVKQPEQIALSKNPEELRQLGFNPDVPLYKGGYGEYPAELMDPQKKSLERAFFLADQPHVAQGYGTVSKYVARPSKAFEVDWGQLAKQTGYAHHDHESGVGIYSGHLMNKIIDAAKEKGADVVIMHNMSDVGGPQTQYAFLNTAPLRAPHANFDPTKLHLRYPLAGLVGGGLFAYGALGGEGNANEMKDGGKVKKRHSQIEENPKDHEFIDFSRGGLIDSDIPGRTDKIPMRVKPGAYVLPADIPSALGQGNSKAGAEVLKKMFTHSAYGLPPPHIHSHEFRYPHHLDMHFSKGKKAKGGGTEGTEGHIQREKARDRYGVNHVPIVAAGGEFIIHPDVVKIIGDGDMKAGHKLLDKFVLHTRKQHINTLKGLKGPK